MSEAENTTPRIVEAVGIATSGRSGKGLARAIEAAMSAAVMKATVEGVTDPDEVRALMLVARAEAKAAYMAEQAKAPEADPE